MKAINQIKIEGPPESFISEGDTDNLVIYGFEKETGGHIILADYHRAEGLIEHYNLKSILTKNQQLMVGRLIDRFDPKR